MIVSDPVMIDRADRAASAIVGEIVGAIRHVTGLSLDRETHATCWEFARREILAVLAAQDTEAVRRIDRQVRVIPHCGTVE